jgi:hypothetical protein
VTRILRSNKTAKIQTTRQDSFLNYANEVSAYFLDGDLFYLGREAEAGVFSMLLLETPTRKVLLVFTNESLAKELFPDQHVLSLPKDDPRAKEEFFRAALKAGATEVWVDGLEPTIKVPTQQALDYILSFKTETACF